MLGIIALAAAIVTPPKPVDPANWITNDDYPAEAVKQGWEGVVAFRLTISPAGAVTDCQITASSGHDVLDQAACSLMKTRGRFDPARTAKGKAVEGSFDRRVRWQIPQEPPQPVRSIYVRNGAAGVECLVSGSIYTRVRADVCRSVADAMQKQGMALPNSVSIPIPDAVIETTPQP